jgi:hypothetical protein
MFLWMMPTPPSLAILMAVSDSVTVSIAALVSGMRIEIPFVSKVSTLVSWGKTSE